MGFSQCNYTENQQIFTNSSNSLSLIPTYNDTKDDDYCDDNYNELKFRSFLMNMIWDFGFGCFVPQKSKIEGQKNSNSEHNKAWLLAESGGDLANGEPHSVHSSFRFSLCSQVELDSLKTANLGSSTTVLMVNLDNISSDSNSKELKWRRIESLEKSISPVTNSLIRFSFDEIRYATRNFSEGNFMGLNSSFLS